MSALNSVIEQARRSLETHDSKAALKILKPYKKSLKNENASNVILYQIFAEAYLENGQLDKAYPLLYHACELDLDGEQGGSEKFFMLGQATGGEDGIKLIFQGLENISKQAGDKIPQEQVDKIVDGLLTAIEIWMTDLCMEPNAESECQELIGRAMEISEGKSPEVWSTMGSIRISQQRYSEACEAFINSWKFFEIKKQDIEAEIKNNDTSSHEQYAQLVQPLLSLAKMCIEMGLYEISLRILGAVKDVDEDNLESYYLEGFTFYLMGKLELFKQNHPNANVNADNIYEFNEHFQELPLDLNNESITEVIQDARLSLSFASKLAQNAEPDDELAQELYAGSNEVLAEIGGPLSDSEMIKIKKGEDDDGNEEEQDLEFEDDE